MCRSMWLRTSDWQYVDCEYTCHYYNTSSSFHSSWVYIYIHIYVHAHTYVCTQTYSQRCPLRKQRFQASTSFLSQFLKNFSTSTSFLADLAHTQDFLMKFFDVSRFFWWKICAAGKTYETNCAAGKIFLTESWCVQDFLTESWEHPYYDSPSFLGLLRNSND